MKKLLQLFAFLLLISASISLQAQKKAYYNEQEQVIEAAYNNLDYNMKEGVLKEWAVANKPVGSYTMKLTIKHKGEVVTIQTIDREGGDIPTQNALKNYMKGYRFPFKMPKDKSYQFQYEFKF